MMLGSAFFPRYYHSRPKKQPMNKNKTIAIHSIPSKSIIKKQDLRAGNRNQKLFFFEVQNRTCRSRQSSDNNPSRLVSTGQSPSSNLLQKFKARRRSLFVKGICKKPSIQIKFNQYQQSLTLPTRDVTTSQTRRIRRKITASAVGTSGIIKNGYAVETSGINHGESSPRLKRRKSKDTYLFKGWQITDEDFNNDF